MLEINPGLILWTIITFLVLAAVLRLMAWKPLLAALSAREEKIRTSLMQAEQAAREAKKLLEDHQHQLHLAEQQSQQIIGEGRALGERLKAELLEKAQQSSRQMLDQAKAEIQREKESALVELRSEAADLAVMAAGKLIDANLDTPKQRQLVDSVMKELTRNA